MKCPHCGKFIKYKNRVQWWDTSSIGYCKKCNKYYVSIHSHTLEVWGGMTGHTSIYSINEKEYNFLLDTKNEFPDKGCRGLKREWKFIKSYSYDLDV